MMISNDWEGRAARAAAPHLKRVAKARLKLSRLSEQDLEAVAEAAIELLDELRDPDEDQCLAGDDGCGPFIGGHNRGVWWGSMEESAGPKLTYGTDQRDIFGKEALPGFRQSWRVD